jgi:hypothetical protein
VEGGWGKACAQRLTPRATICRKLVPARWVNVKLLERLERSASYVMVGAPTGRSRRSGTHDKTQKHAAW